MIVSLPLNVSKVALRINTYGNAYRITDWKKLQLVILPVMHTDVGCCFLPLSPWYFRGCWPCHVPTDVNINAPRFGHDFSPIVYNAVSMDADGRIVFGFDKQLWALPAGRYLGIVRTAPAKTHSCGSPCEPRDEVEHSHMVAQFDIDYGNMCREHFIDQISSDVVTTMELD